MPSKPDPRATFAGRADADLIAERQTLDERSAAVRAKVEERKPSREAVAGEVARLQEQARARLASKAKLRAFMYSHANASVGSQSWAVDVEPVATAVALASDDLAATLRRVLGDGQPTQAEIDVEEQKIADLAKRSRAITTELELRALDVDADATTAKRDALLARLGS